MPHTPMPWKRPYLDSLPNGLKAWRVDSSGENGVAVIALCYTGDDEITDIQRDNAYLIYAAPELLAACERMLHVAGQGEGQEATWDEAYDPIRAAVAKAKGGAA